MIWTCVLGIDVGTSSTKAVLVSPSGEILREARRMHEVSHPEVGHVEMDPGLWWAELVSLTRELLDDHVHVTAVGISAMGPCVVLTDDGGQPVRPAILYGVDTRASAEVDELDELFGRSAILERCGSELSSQAAGPKILWVSRHEPTLYSRAVRVFSAHSWLVHHLTAEYVLDRHTASQFTPMYDRHADSWDPAWSAIAAPGIELPDLADSTELAGTVTSEASLATGLPAGTPVVVGTIDAWAEAVSVGADRSGDLMLMYGTTMFLIAALSAPTTCSGLWATAGVTQQTWSLAGGMATSGAITSWLAKLFGEPGFELLFEEAGLSPPGANGLLMLPYFAGERTPIFDPHARGVIAGLTLSHTRGDLYRAGLEATAFGVRHNLEHLARAGVSIERVVAVGGGVRSQLWLQIVSDVTGLPQSLTRTTVGASFGSAFLASSLVHGAEIDEWNPVVREVLPTGLGRYDALYDMYRNLYLATTDITHALANMQRSHDSNFRSMKDQP